MKTPVKIHQASAFIALAIVLCGPVRAEGKVPAKTAGEPAVAAQELYKVEGTDPTLAELLKSGAIVTGDRMGKGPARGARVVVDQERLEKLTGKLPPLDTKNITGIQHQAGHGGRTTFDDWSRFYQEDGNTQIRSHQRTTRAARHAVLRIRNDDKIRCSLP